jgi:hypothetical protein
VAHWQNAQLSRYLTCSPQRYMRTVARQTTRVRPNHSLKRRANSVPPGPLHFCGLSSVPRACWHTVASRLAQTLGRTERKFQAACFLVNSCSPAAAQVARSVRNTSANCRERCQMHYVTFDHRQFNQRKFDGLSNGASRRALRRIVSQLSRPRASNGKATAVRLHHRVFRR